MPILTHAPACRVCGCTDERACEGGCSWVEPDLCSQCQLRIFEDLMRRLQPMTLELPPVAAFCLIGQIQLACRHPDNLGPMREIVEELAREIQQAFAGQDPEFGRLVEQGWVGCHDGPRIEEAT